MGGGEQDGHDQLGHGELRWNALNEIVSWAFWTIFWTKVIPYTWIPYFFFFLDRFYKLGIQSVWIIIVVVIYYSLFEKIQLPDFLFKVELICSRFFFSFFLPKVFAPNILHCVKPGQRSEVSAERAEERIDVINVVRALLEHATTLFTVPAALLDEVYLHMMDTHPADLDLALSRRVEEWVSEWRFSIFHLRYPSKS